MSVVEWLVGTLDSLGKSNVVALTLVAVGSLLYGFFFVGRGK